MFATNASDAIWWSNMELMQLAPSSRQIWNQYASGASNGKIGNQCKWCHLVVKYVTNVSGAIWWANFQLMQLASSGGQIWNLCKWCHLVANFVTICKWCHLMANFAINAIGAIWWSNLESICKWCIRWQNWQPMQVAPSGGQICNQFKKFH